MFNSIYLLLFNNTTILIWHSGNRLPNKVGTYLLEFEDGDYGVSLFILGAKNWLHIRKVKQWAKLK